jgi:hypothetical protein
MKSYVEAQYICKTDEKGSAVFEIGMRETANTTFLTPVSHPEAWKDSADHNLKTTATGMGAIKNF